MPQNERLRVWKGELKKTSGGLRKQDLMKNKRGKIVSKKKSEAAKKNKENNLGQWLRSKGDQFLSKGLKQENIIRKNKAGRKAFKKKAEEVPEEKQSEVPETKQKKAQPKKSGSGTSGSSRKRQQAPPKIEKVAPMAAGEKKEMQKISVGNIIGKGKSSLTAKQKWIKKAKFYKKKLKKDLAWVTKKLGAKPEGVFWNEL